jgi:two-component system, cell cycle response regulator DivK
MKPTVLIIDDEPMNLKLFCDVLQMDGYTTLEASNGLQGVELARIHQPDLILMDVQMPVMDGFKATSTQSIPVIALTAYAAPDRKEQLRQVGCDGYIAKPIQIQDFLEQIATYLTYNV